MERGSSPLFNEDLVLTIGILGLGLIGGSLGLDLTALGYPVLGVSRQAQTCALACARGAVRVASTQWDLLQHAHIIFVCTPIDQTLPAVARLSKVVRPGTVITDVASVKEPIVARATNLWPWFVGGHPMAGTAEVGMQAAVRDLFRERPYVLTPLPETVPEALAQMQEIVDRLGAQIVQAQPLAHDRAVALISHAPVFISAALLLMINQPDLQLRGLAQQLASSGFRDTSRVGGGNPELGLLMAQYNRDALLAALADYQEQFTRLSQAIQEENWTVIQELLDQTQSIRQTCLSLTQVRR